MCPSLRLCLGPPPFCTLGGNGLLPCLSMWQCWLNSWFTLVHDVVGPLLTLNEGNTLLSVYMRRRLARLPCCFPLNRQCIRLVGLEFSMTPGTT